MNPVTGKTLAEVAEADKADVDLAVSAAKKAFERGSEWRDLGKNYFHKNVIVLFIKSFKMICLLIMIHFYQFLDASQRGKLLNK